MEILVIDDDPREGLAEVLGAEWKHPWDVTEQDVLDAGLIVIDQYLQKWKFDDGTPATMHPRGGLAVAAVLRSQLVQSRTPIVIFTGALDELGRTLPSAIRRPVLASEFGVEWVTSRTDGDLRDQLVALQRAAAALPAGGVIDAGIGRLARDWLRLPREPWSDAALLDLQECHPARTRSSTDEPGMVFLRWFVHQILPYPSFLLDLPRAAIRLGIKLEDLEALLVSKSHLGSLLEGAKYVGEMDDFFGQRFWRAGLDYILDGAPVWNEGENSTSDVLSRLAGADVDVLEGSWRVAVDGDLQMVGAAPLDALVRILPDHWPTFADDAFALTEDVDSDDRLAAWRARTQPEAPQ